MNIAFYTVKSVAMALTEPLMVALLVLLALLLYRQNRKTIVMQKMILGQGIDSALELTISQIVIGIFAGTAASIILSYLGVVFDENSSVDLIFLLSILLTFYSPRFICFSYSASLLGIISLILRKIGDFSGGGTMVLFGYKLELANLDFLAIDAAAVLALVAVLHFVEAILVMIDGKRGAIPVFTNRDEKIVGGFALQRYWVLPVALLVLFRDTGTMGGITSGVISLSTPGWWPLIINGLPLSIIKAAALVAIPFYGVIGYHSVTFTKSKSEKSVQSGIYILIYSMVVMALSRLATVHYLLAFIALLAAAFLHEYMLQWQKKREDRGEPLYVSGDDGVMVLEVAPTSPAAEMGIVTGDKLVNINGYDIKNEEELMDALHESGRLLTIEVKKLSGDKKSYSNDHYSPQQRLGVVFVPRLIPKDSMVVNIGDSRFQEVLSKLKNRLQQEGKEDEKDKDSHHNSEDEDKK